MGIIYLLLPRQKRREIENVFSKKRPNKDDKNQDEDKTEASECFLKTSVSFRKN